MIGIDTDILIRWLVSDPTAPAQSTLVVDFLESAGGDMLVGSVVLAELAWVLESRFKFRRAQVGAVLLTLLDAPVLKFDSRNAVECAIGAFQDGRADLSDYLIAELNHSAGCQTTMTFDKAAAKGPHFTLLA